MAHILVIDDDAFIRLTLCQALDQAGYTTSEAANGKIGMRICRESAIDLVITDLLMPEQEGLETIMELRSEAPQIKIIAFSGGGMLGLVSFLEVAAKLGAHHTFVKPLDMREVLDTVQRLLAEE